MDLRDEVLRSFPKSWSLERPFLLGLSGGPDSMALYLLLVEMQVPFQVAHVDHGWREESRDEALILKKITEADGIPYHTIRLNLPEKERLRESECRSARLQFFASLCREHSLQGVALAHQREDQVETILKKILEGSDFSHLQGIQVFSTWENVQIWRPLLSVARNEIVSFLQARDQDYFNDPSNESLRYLRPRMRKSLIPTLEKTFGKSIEKPLVRLAKSSGELNQFLDRLFRREFEQVVWEKDEGRWDISEEIRAERFLLKEGIRRFCRLAGETPNVHIIESVVDAIENKKSNVRFPFGKREFYWNKDCLFLDKID